MREMRIFGINIGRSLPALEWAIGDEACIDVQEFINWGTWTNSTVRIIEIEGEFAEIEVTHMDLGSSFVGSKYFRFIDEEGGYLSTMTTPVERLMVPLRSLRQL